MANQVDREGLQPLVQAWREHAEQLPKLWPRLADRAEMRASAFRDCADELSAALQGSVASPQDEIELRLDADALAMLTMIVRQYRLSLQPNAPANVLINVVQEGLDRLMLQTIKGTRSALRGPLPAGSGATTPAPQKSWTDELCSKCEGNGVVKIPGGISVCPRCDGRCYEPSAGSGSAERSQEDQHRKNER